MINKKTPPEPSLQLTSSQVGRTDLSLQTAVEIKQQTILLVTSAIKHRGKFTAADKAEKAAIVSNTRELRAIYSRRGDKRDARNLTGEVWATVFAGILSALPPGYSRSSLYRLMECPKPLEAGTA